MGLFETFSKRKRKAAGEIPDVYQYDSLPPQFRVQVIHIWGSAIGHVGGRLGKDDYWQNIHDTIARELGVFNLGTQNLFHFVQCQEFVQKADTDQALDLIELTARVIDGVIRQQWDFDRSSRNLTQTPDDAIEELNARFREHGVGYQYEDGILIRADSLYLHTEVVKPALHLLSGSEFAGARQEFITAHEHFRHGRNKEAIVEALKSFESTMKCICEARKWACPNDATAKRLIEVVFQHGLVPPPLQSEFTALAAVMECGLPTIRNKTSGHGQGAKPTEMPQYVAAFALHLAAANIVFLVEAHKAN
jgi:hypothetical protein